MGQRARTHDPTAHGAGGGAKSVWAVMAHVQPVCDVSASWGHFHCSVLTCDVLPAVGEGNRGFREHTMGLFWFFQVAPMLPVHPGCIYEIFICGQQWPTIDTGCRCDFLYIHHMYGGDQREMAGEA